MSLHAMIAVLDAPPQREHSDRLVMIEFGNEAGSDGANCRPGKNTIADNSGVSPRTVTDCIERLEGDGWVWVHHRGRGRVNHYVLLLPGLKEIVPSSWSCKACLGQAQAYRDDVKAGRRSPYPDHATPPDDPEAPQTSPVDSTEKQGDGRPTAPVDNQPAATREVGRPASPTRATGVPKQGDQSPMTRMTRLDPDTLAATSGDDESELASHQQLVDALVEACNLDTPLTAAAGAAVGGVAKQLREVGATPDEVAARADRYRAAWPDVRLTVHALAKHWSTFGPPTDTTVRSDDTDGAVTMARNLAGLPWDDVESMLLNNGYDSDAADAAREAWDLAQDDGAAA